MYLNLDMNALMWKQACKLEAWYTYPILLFASDGMLGGTGEEKLMPCEANAVKRAIKGMWDLEQEKREMYVSVSNALSFSL